MVKLCRPPALSVMASRGDPTHSTAGRFPPRLLGWTVSDASELAGNAPPLRVLARPAFRTRSRNPYNWLLYTHIAKVGVEVYECSRARLLAGHYDLWHLHWPEQALNAPNIGRAVWRTAGLLALLRWMRWHGTKVVWTIHNLQAHEDRYPRLERWFWRSFTAQLDGHISLSCAGQEFAHERFPSLRNAPGFVIPHGHYRDLYPVPISQQAAREALGIQSAARVAAFVGQIRPYKNVRVLITEFQRIADADVILLIGGSPLDSQLRSELCKAARDDARVRLDLRFLSDAEIQVYVSAADMVVLPYREVLNSGSAVLALSLNRPILVPKAVAFAELQASVGAEWVSMYEGGLTASRLEQAFRWAIGLARAPTAPLQTMDWDRIADATVEAYTSILKLDPASTASSSGRRWPADSQPRPLDQPHCGQG
jgi:beta-1,4-mannosyltransferase